MDLRPGEAVGVERTGRKCFREAMGTNPQGAALALVGDK